MGYCEIGDLELACGQGLQAVLKASPERAQVAISQAASDIDGYLVSGGYCVPLQPVPANIKGYAIDLALYNLAVLKGLNKENAADEAVIDKAKIARDFLKQVALGKYRIPVQGSSGGSASDSTRKIKVSRGIRPVDMRGYF